MDDDIQFYSSPSSMEPLFPEDPSGKLENLVTILISRSAKLSGALHPITQKALGAVFRPMNSYYSNLIEGHDTHPIDIEKALNNDYSDNKSKRILQEEALAHISLYQKIEEEIKADNSKVNPTSADFIKSIHQRFYEYLSDDLKKVTSLTGDVKIIIPGALRLDEVEVGKHIAPLSSSLEKFMDRFEEFYNPNGPLNRSKIRRIISIAASHHRLAWIHPFLDGNGRVVRLYSDANFIFEGLDASGLWSISRGFARKNSLYRSMLANADLQRYNDYDGRGNLSNRMLLEFCEFFFETAIDQIDFMYRMLDIDHMLERIKKFTELMAQKGKLRPEAALILSDIFLKGKITKSEAMQITNLSDKTLKLLTDSLAVLGLLEAKKEGIHINYYVKYPIRFSPVLFPGIYPGNMELEMFAAI